MTSPTDDLARLLAGGSGRLLAPLSALLMAVDDPFWHLDLTLRTMTWSRAVEEALGYRHGEVPGSLGAWLRRIHAQDRGRVFRSAARALQGGADNWTADLRIARTDDTYAPVRARAVVLRDEAGRPAAMLGSLRTVSGTARQWADVHDELERLIERAVDGEERREALEHVVDEALWDWDIEADRVRRNDGLARLLGYRDDEIEGTYAWWIARVHPEDRDEVARKLREHLRGGPELWETRYRFRRADGSYVPVRDRASVMLAPDGSPRRVVGAMAPLTEPGGASRGVIYLTPRQAEILELVRAGHTSKEIAGRLGISEQGVKDHVTRLLERFAAPNRAALVAAASAHDVRVEDRPADRTHGPSHGRRRSPPAVVAALRA